MSADTLRVAFRLPGATRPSSVRFPVHLDEMAFEYAKCVSERFGWSEVHHKSGLVGRYFDGKPSADFSHTAGAAERSPLALR